MAALTNQLDFSYFKRKNSNLFLSLEKYEITKLQNYLPVYNKFFSLNETNYNNINLNQKYNLESIQQKNTENRYTCKIINGKNSIKRESFFKFSPLLDPIKFIWNFFTRPNFELAITCLIAVPRSSRQS